MWCSPGKSKGNDFQEADKANTATTTGSKEELIKDKERATTNVPKVEAVVIKVEEAISDFMGDSDDPLRPEKLSPTPPRARECGAAASSPKRGSRGAKLTISTAALSSEGKVGVSCPCQSTENWTTMVIR